MTGLTIEQRLDAIVEKINLLLEQQLDTISLEDAATMVETLHEAIESKKEEVRALERAVDILQYQVQKLKDERTDT